MTATRDASPDSLSSDERETVITVTDADQSVHIWTAQKRHITRMRKHDSFTETATGYHGTTEWASFTIPARDWNPASGAKRKRNLTDEQRQALADRLARSREARS